MNTTVPQGLTCTVEEWLLSQDRTPNISQQLQCLAPTDYVGLTIITQAGLVSLVAITYVFGRIARNMLMIAKAGRRSIFSVFKEANDIFMFSLFLADVLQAIGAVMDIKWMSLGIVRVGSYCTAQGVIQQLGETAVALASLTIAAYTFFSVWFNTGIERRRTALAIASFTWIPVVMLVLIGNLVPRADKRQYISPTPYWCWISQAFMPWRIGGEYFWFWFTLLFSLLSHTLLFFWLRGNIVLDEKRWWIVTFQRSKKQKATFDTSEETTRRRNAVVMLAYPVVYCITILPASIVRWIGFVQEAHGGQNTIPSAATFASIAIHDLSGLFNVILLLTTRSGSTLFGGIHGMIDEDDTDGDDVSMPPTPPAKSRVGDPESASTTESQLAPPPRRRPRPASVNSDETDSSEIMHLPRQ